MSPEAQATIDAAYVQAYATWGAAIIGLTGALAAVVISWRVTRKVTDATLRDQQFIAIRNDVSRLVELTIAHPEFEVEEWSSKALAQSPATPDRVRYENYCIFVFNLIKRVWEYCKGDDAKIDEALAVEELIKLHKAWWNCDLKTCGRTYQNDFVNFVNVRLRKLVKEKPE